MNQSYKKSWLEKYATAISILVSVTLTIGGWLYANSRDRKNELRDIKNNYISNAYKDISLFTLLFNHKLTTKEDFFRFDRSLKDIQLYGTLEEINAAKELIRNVNTKGFSYDKLLNLIRDNLRKEYGLEKVEGNTWWALDTNLLKNAR